MTVPGERSPYILLEQQIGHAFQDQALCEAALTHRSWINECGDKGRPDNERLEFLGDAVIALVMSDLLMKRHPRDDEGELSRRRSALVNEQALARLAEGLQLGQWIFLGHGEERTGGRQRPSTLSDALEAVIGAVYLDGGFEAAFRVADRLFRPVLDRGQDVAGRDHKSRLQELSQARMHLAPTYTVVGEEGPDHDRTFEVAIFLGEREYGRAHGKSKKEASQNAAARALEALQADPGGDAPGAP